MYSFKYWCKQVIGALRGGHTARYVLYANAPTSFISEDDKQFYWVVRKKDKQLEHGYVIDPRNFLSYALTWNVRKLDWENPPKAAVRGEVYRAIDQHDDGPDQ